MTIAFALLLGFLTLASRAVSQELPTAKPEDVGVSPEKVQRLSSYMQSLADEGKIAGGVTLMARHGKVIHLKAVGMADLEERKPMQTDSIFRIASMTKPITSVAIMMLWEQGKLGLDDPVSKYVPEFKDMKVVVNFNPLKTGPTKGEITIRHLLTHTSGLAYLGKRELGALYRTHNIHCGLSTTDLTLKQNIERLAELPLQFQPGEKWKYGMSTDVLGRVVEVVSGATLDRYFERHICTPLAMNDTFFRVPVEKRSRLVSVYVPGETCLREVRPGERLREIMVREEAGFAGMMTLSSDYPYSTSHVAESGGTGLSSTATDYMRFCQMLLDGGQLNGTQLLDEDTVTMMTENQIGDLSLGKSNMKFGFGFAVLPDQAAVHPQLRESYSWGGYWCTSFRISPQGEWIVITMTQVAGRPTDAEYDSFAADAVEE
jgi:CubicO group peptidase (beta-lactamase class C family)